MYALMINHGHDEALQKKYPQYRFRILTGFSKGDGVVLPAWTSTDTVAVRRFEREDEAERALQRVEDHYLRMGKTPEVSVIRYSKALIMVHEVARELGVKRMIGEIVSGLPSIEQLASCLDGNGAQEVVDAIIRNHSRL